jgi:hypothetical protein
VLYLSGMLMMAWKRAIKTIGAAKPSRAGFPAPAAHA